MCDSSGPVVGVKLVIVCVGVQEGEEQLTETSSNRQGEFVVDTFSN